MVRRSPWCATVLAGMLTLSSCASMQQTYDDNPKAVLGALLGAAAGAGIAAAAGGGAIGSAVVDGNGRQEIAWFVQQMQPYPQAVLLVQGFADTPKGRGRNRRVEITVR